MKSVLLMLVVVAASTLAVTGSERFWMDSVEPFIFGPSSLSAAPTCAKTSCKDEGMACSGVGDTCLLPFVCIDGECSSFRSLYEECSADFDCNSADGVVFGRFCDSGGKCQKLVGMGGSCSCSSECDVHLSCSNKGRCTTEGVTLGEACSEEGNLCRVPLVCHNGRCSALAQENSSCSTTLPCDLGLCCVGDVCVRRWSLPEGSQCIENSCAPPLVCSRTGVCVVPTSSIIQQEPCTCDEDCAPDSVCKCDWASGKLRCTVRTYPSSSARVLYSELLACIKKNNYDRRKCYSKLLSFLHSRWEASAYVPSPELWCAISNQNAISPHEVFFAAVLLLAVLF